MSIWGRRKCDWVALSTPACVSLCHLPLLYKHVSNFLKCSFDFLTQSFRSLDFRFILSLAVKTLRDFSMQWKSEIIESQKISTTKIRNVCGKHLSLSFFFSSWYCRRYVEESPESSSSHAPFYRVNLHNILEAKTLLKENLLCMWY